VITDFYTPTPLHAAYSTPWSQNTIILSRHGPWIGLSSNFDMLIVGEVDMLYERVCIEWVEVESVEGWWYDNDVMRQCSMKVRRTLRMIGSGATISKLLSPNPTIPSLPKTRPYHT
jgi:hypothetical protein